MSEFARIDSIDALKTLRTFLCNFAKKISVATDEADFEILDTLNWLKNDRYPFWKNEVRLRNELLVKAKLELKRKQIMDRAIGGHNSCIDEIKAFAAAQKRFDEAQEKFKKVQRWILNVEKECFDCRGALHSLANFVRIDLVNYRTQIDQMIYSLESYMNVSAPVAAFERTSGSEMPSVARAAEHVWPSVDELERLCMDLRGRNLLKSDASLPTESPVSSGLKHLAIEPNILEILAKNSKEISSESQNERFAFDLPFELSEYLYFEHLTADANRGFTWYFGRVEPEKAIHAAVCTLAEVLKEYPLIKPILALPVGWVILVKKNTVEAVFNADNKCMAYRQP